MSYNLLAISGSLRKNSTNTGLLHAFATHAPETVSFTYADISNIPLYNEDNEITEYPTGAIMLKDQIRKADGIVIATPEYNRGTSAVLKNAIEWTTRPDGDNVWAGKPVFIIGASSGTLGTVNAQYELKKSMLYLKARVLGQPEFYVTFNRQKFSENGELTDVATVPFIEKALAAFTAHIDLVR